MISEKDYGEIANDVYKVDSSKVKNSVIEGDPAANGK
ncbi:Uncharacterised protein [Streptococcus equi subsp. zooepidemicus]|nr:Uncharacterised protein [Streptococcus equi subsp. zooepidemicus]